MPVALVFGRFRLAVSPVLTGSPPITNTIGIVEVADFAASAEGSPPPGHERCRAHAHQFGRKFRQTLVMPVGPAIFDSDVLPWDIAALAEAAEKTCRVRLRVFLRAAAHESNQRQELLCMHPERTSRSRAAEQREELAAFELNELHALPLGVKVRGQHNASVRIASGARCAAGFDRS
jgi:hypothetical protein